MSPITSFGRIELQKFEDRDYGRRRGQNLVVDGHQVRGVRPWVMLEIWVQGRQKGAYDIGGSCSEAASERNYCPSAT